jgi:hypothetical protein
MTVTAPQPFEEDPHTVSVIAYFLLLHKGR